MMNESAVVRAPIRRKFVVFAAAVSLLLVLTLLAFGLWGWLPFRDSVPSTARVGRPAPDITAALLENGQPGKQVNLGMLRGRPTVLNFWATWCVPCRAEFPVLDAAYRKYQDSHRLQMIALQVQGDLGSDKAQDFIGEMGTSFPIWLTLDSVPEDAYHVQALPTTVFIDRNGIIQDIVVGGPMTAEYLEKELGKIF